MKKIISLLSLLFVMASFSARSQSNVSWIVKDDVSGDNYFRKTTVFNLTILGFTNKAEASKFLDEMRNNKDVASCEQVFSDANGNGDIKLTMKNPQDKVYYLNWAKKLHVSYIQSGREKKTPEQWLSAGDQK